MTGKTTPSRKRKYFILTVLISGALACGLWLMSWASIQKTYRWHDIIPGQTTMTDALARLGEADEIQNRGPYQIFIYKDRPDLERRRVELWFEQEKRNWVVSAIFMMGLLEDEVNSTEDYQSLEPLLVHYGKPDWVKWTAICYTRSLVWPEYGIAAGVGVGHFNPDLDPPSYWREFPVIEILFFKPMPAWKFQFTRWPWPDYSASWVGNNMCLPPYNAPETLPKDPFDWSRLSQLPAR